MGMTRAEMVEEWLKLAKHDAEMARDVTGIIKGMDCTGILYVQGTEKPREIPPKYQAPFSE